MGAVSDPAATGHAVRVEARAVEAKEVHFWRSGQDPLRQLTAHASAQLSSLGVTRKEKGNHPFLVLRGSEGNPNPKKGNEGLRRVLVYMYREFRRTPFRVLQVSQPQNPPKTRPAGRPS